MTATCALPMIALPVLGRRDVVKKLVVALIVLLAILHQDFWWWDDRTTLFGFLPVSLVWHAGISLAAALVGLLAVSYCWPQAPDEEGNGEGKPPGAPFEL